MSVAARSARLQELADSLGGPGRIRTAAIDRYAMANDASHFLLTPEAVIVARDAADVARLLVAGGAAGVSLTFRSGGTSLSGQGITDGVLVDVRRNFRRIDVLDAGLRVRVQPGATVRQVNARLARHGRKLGPDPASESGATIGGVVANNSSGMSCGTTANTYRTLESMVLVLPSGTVVDTSRADADARLRSAEPELYHGLIALRDRVRAVPASVETIRRQFSMKNTMGYAVNSFLDFDDPVQLLAHLIVGSEGTLGFVADVVFRTVPARTQVATGFLVFEDLFSANAALPALVETGAAAIELLDATSLRVAQRDPDAHPLIRQLEVRDHAALLIEYEAESEAELGRLTTHAAEMLAGLTLAHEPMLTRDSAVRADLWHLRKGLYASVAGARPTGTTALLEDVVVPVPALARTCADLMVLFAEHGYEDCVIFGHAKDGNIHFMLTDAFDDPDSIARYAEFTERMVALVLGQGGSLKAEHGTGRVMAPYVRRQFGDELYDVMKTVKSLCDPRGLLNPGVVLTDDPEAHLRHLKTFPAVDDEVDRCVECGYCEPVCPSRDLTLTPRQRIVVRRAVATARAGGAQTVADELERDYDYAGVQTCAVDGMCQTACPVLINTGDLVRRLRVNGHTAAEEKTWTALAGGWATATRVASTALTVASRLPAKAVQAPNALARRIVGDEVLPEWSPELPAGGRTRRSRAAVGIPEAVYLPACVNAMFGPAAGGKGVQRSLEQLCERAGIVLVVPTDVDGLCCGTPWSSKGLPAGAETMRERTLRSLREASRNGELPIVCDASSCTEGLLSMVQKDGALPGLTIIDSVQFVAQRVLPNLPKHERLKSLTMHPTCSSTRLGTTPALMEVASAVADTVTVPDSWGCCAFAGDRGMLHPELTASATLAQAAEIAAIGGDVHASCNRTCELGMTRATGEEYRHVLELLEEVTRL